MDLALKGKQVFITASSGGIGLKTAESFLKEGSCVILNGRNAKKLEQITRMLKKKYPEADVYHVAADVSTRAGILYAKEFISHTCGHLDAIVFNLGDGKPETDQFLDEDEWRRMLETNLFAQVMASDALVGLLKKDVDSSIVFITSIAGDEFLGAPMAYAAAKAGVKTLIKGLACKLAADKIRVNGVSPGNILFPGGRWEEKRKENPERVQEMLDQEVPLKRFGTPEEIADTVVFLSSGRSSFTTGSVCVVDGGQSRKF